MDIPNITREQFAIHWPEPPHVALVQASAPGEPCAIELRNGSTQEGDLLHFTGREPYLIFAPSRQSQHHGNKIAVKLANVRQLRLTDAVAIRPLDAPALNTAISPPEIQVYNVEFDDGEITSGETVGSVKSPLGVFLFLQKGDAVERLFIPDEALSYFQVGDPIGKLLIEENVVSEAQLKEAVEKQQQMRKLVLGDYLLEEGYITREQLDEALEYQKLKPSLRLGEALIELGLLTGDALQNALARQRANRGRPLGQILVDMGVVDSDTLKKVQAKQMGLPFISLTTLQPNEAALALVPPSVARRLNLVPLAVEDGSLIVCAASQPSPDTMNELGLLARMRVVAVLGLPDEIIAKQDEFYGAEEIEVSALPADMGLGLDELGTTRGSDVAQQFERLMHTGEPLEITQDVTLATERDLRELLSRLLDVGLRGGQIEIRIATQDALRRATLRFQRDR